MLIILAKLTFLFFSFPNNVEKKELWVRSIVTNRAFKDLFRPFSRKIYKQNWAEDRIASGYTAFKIKKFPDHLKVYLLYLLFFDRLYIRIIN